MKHWISTHFISLSSFVAFHFNQLTASVLAGAEVFVDHHQKALSLDCLQNAKPHCVDLQQAKVTGGGKSAMPHADQIHPNTGHVALTSPDINE